MVRDDSAGQVVDSIQNEAHDASEHDGASMEESSVAQPTEIDNAQLVEPESAKQSQLRRSSRERRPSTRYSSNMYVTLIDEGEP